MNRRQMLLGAIAAPLAAPAVAKAAAEPARRMVVGIDLSTRGAGYAVGGVVRAGRPYIVGEIGHWPTIPAGRVTRRDGAWAAKTPDQIIADINRLLGDVWDRSPPAA